jgi:hypothetical protein
MSKTKRMILGAIDVSSRRNRKKNLLIITECVQKICEAEERYLFFMPKNLQSGERYEATEDIIYAFYNIINELWQVYDH